MHQQRGADAAESSSQDDTRFAGLEAAVLELSGASHGARTRQVALRITRDAVTDTGLVGLAAVDSGATTTVPLGCEHDRCRATAGKSARSGGSGLSKPRLHCDGTGFPFAGHGPLTPTRQVVRLIYTRTENRAAVASALSLLGSCPCSSLHRKPVRFLQCRWLLRQRSRTSNLQNL